MSATAPHLTALADQLSAATDEAARTVQDAVNREPGMSLTHIQPHPWLAEQFTKLGLALTFGTAQLCPHIGPGPRAVHAAVWAPGRLVCPHCVRLLRPSAEEDTICDRCRKPSDVLHAHAVVFGPVILGYGLCPQCQSILDTANHPRKEHHQ